MVEAAVGDGALIGVVAQMNGTVDRLLPTEFHGRIGTTTRPLVVTCKDGERYVVKAVASGQDHRNRTHARSLVNDHVVGRLAGLMGAPVPPVAIVHLTESFLQDADISDLQPGPAHGSRKVSGARICVIAPSFGGPQRFYVAEDAWPIVMSPDNRPRFAGLAVLHTWVGLNGLSFSGLVHDPRPPYLVFSVDHEDHGSPLPATPLPATPAAILARLTDGPVKLTAGDFVAATEALRHLSEQTIVSTFVSVPDEWRLPEGALDQMCGAFLDRRRLLVSALETAFAAVC